MYVDPIGGVLPEKTYINCLPRQNAEREFTLTRKINPQPFIQSEDMEAACEEVFNIQVMGLAKRLVHTHCKKVVIGVSGGLDSTLALLVCVRAFDKLKLEPKGYSCRNNARFWHLRTYIYQCCCPNGRVGSRYKRNKHSAIGGSAS